VYSLLHIDWLSVTIPVAEKRHIERLEDLQLWQRIDGPSLTRDDSKWRVSAPQYGYTHAYTSSHGTICMFGQVAMGIHIIYSGQSLQALASKGIDAERIIRNATDRGAKATRVDIALDIIDGRTGVRAFETSVRNSSCTTSSKTWRVLENGSGGHTLYIGARTSERMVRIYDKKAERASVYEEVQNSNWVRCEVELKGDRAKDFMNACRDNDITDVMRSHLIATVDFPGIREYQEALTMEGAWIEPTKTKRKDTQTRHWLMTRVASVIAREGATDPEFYAKLLSEVNAQIEALLRGKGAKLD
jgi:hypothetical protein